MEFETIQYQVLDNILTVTLNRPDRLNAFNSRMVDELLHAMDLADADDDVRVVVFAANGRVFCAGAELPEEGDLSSPAARAKLGLMEGRDSGGRIVLRLFESKKPLIAACQGAAVGFGATFQLGMDIRLASSKARYGFVFPRRGSVMEGCSSWFLPRLVGMQTAMEWVSTGRIFGAEEAARRNLVLAVHEPEALMPAAYAIAREIADNTSGVAVALNRHLMWKMLGAEHPMVAHRVESQGIFELGKSADAREGILSFLEKRPAKFPLKVSSDMPAFFPWWKDAA